MVSRLLVWAHRNARYSTKIHHNGVWSYPHCTISIYMKLNWLVGGVRLASRAKNQIITVILQIPMIVQIAIWYLGVAIFFWSPPSPQCKQSYDLHIKWEQTKRRVLVSTLEIVLKISHNQQDKNLSTQPTLMYAKWCVVIIDKTLQI